MHWNHPNRSRKTSKGLCVVIGLTTWMLLFVFVMTFHLQDAIYDATDIKSFTYTDGSLSRHDNPLRFIPQKTTQLWDKRDFLVVFGIPSLDIPKRRWRRKMQRTTCWQFPEVATRYNNYTGAMLVLYLLARHPIHKFALSDELVEEAEQWRDIVIHPMNEGNPTSNKLVNGKGYWGTEAEIGSSRKTFFWFQFALRQFPRVLYLAKGDDDMFLRVPQYLADLRRLPRKGIYWGSYAGAMVRIDNEGREGDLKFLLGFCVTLASDVAEQFVSYKPLQRLVSLPYSKELEPEFTLLTMYHEDAMISRVLNLTGYFFIFIAEGYERFRTHVDSPVTKNVVVTHTPTENEYYLMMNKFLLNATTTQNCVIKKQTPRLFFVDPPPETK